MLRTILFCLLGAWSAVAMAADLVVVETNPRNPVKGQPFQIVFRCQAQQGEDPVINFEPEGFELGGRQSQGVSTRTVYHQGKIHVTRELLVTYDAMAPKAGRVFLRNLVVLIDGKRLTEPSVAIQVVEEPVEPQVIFVRAEVPKRTLWIGEGVTIRYYVYRKVHLQAFDIKKFPKLTGFMKRYLQEQERVERVIIDGEAFSRSGIYDARIFPERAGTITVDPMEVEATYSSDPFASLGFGFGGGGGPRTVRVHSAPVEIKVKELPPGAPASFGGLVGAHEFELKASGARILVNEPMEVRLSVSGPGNLEHFRAPVLWEVPQLEQFEAKSDLALTGGEAAVKTLDYTFLGKAPGLVAARNLEFSFFDPVSGRYETRRLPLPEVTVGGNANSRSTNPSAEGRTTPPKSEKSAPILDNPTPQGATWWQETRTWLFAALLVLAGLLAMATRAWWVGQRVSAAGWEEDYRRAMSGSLDTATLTRLLHALSPDRGRPVREVVGASDLPEASKAYFNDLLAHLERREFATSSATGDINADKGHLRALKRVLKRTRWKSSIP